MQKGIPDKQIDGLGLGDLELALDDHYQLEYSEGLKDEDSESNIGYLLLSNSFSLLCLTLLMKIGILSGWNLRIISAY